MEDRLTNICPLDTITGTVSANLTFLLIVGLEALTL